MQRSTSWPSGPASMVRLLSLALLFSLVILTPVAAFTQSADLATPGASTVRDGVVVDAARGVAFLMNAAGGIDAIDLAAGNVVWTSEEAARPLALAGDQLIAQGVATEKGVLPLVALNAGTGTVAGTVARLPLAENVWARVDQGLGITFRVNATLEGTDLLVAWSQTRAGNGKPAQGYYPSDQEGATPGAAPRRAPAAAGPSVEEGVARVNLVTGRVAQVGAQELASRGFAAHMTIQTGSFVANVPGRQFLSADGRHVLVSQRETAQNEYPWQGAYRWTIYDRASGAHLLELTRPTSTSPFVVAAGRLLYESRPTGIRTEGGMVEQPLMVRAVDLTTGNELWARQIRNTDYEGPFPP